MKLERKSDKLKKLQDILVNQKIKSEITILSLQNYIKK